MGDDAARVHFCPCAGCGDNRTYRDSCVRELSLAVLHLPDVFVQQSLCGNHLAAVDHAAAAHSQNEVYMLLTGNGRTFLHLCIGGVRHDTGKINNRFICLFKQRFYFIIDAILFDGAAAVGKQHCLAFLSKLCAESLRRAPLTKIHLRRIRKSEIVHAILFLQS